MDSSVSTCGAMLTLFSHYVCLVLDALRGTPLRTDGDPSGFHRTRRDQQTPHKHREARNAQAEGGGGLDISTLPDNMTQIVVSWVPTDRLLISPPFLGSAPSAITITITIMMLEMFWCHFLPSQYQFWYPDLRNSQFRVLIQYQCIKHKSLHISFDFLSQNIGEFRYFTSSVGSLRSPLLRLKIKDTSGSTAQLPEYCFRAIMKNSFHVCNVSQR